jgi:hypothetical protein
LCAGAAAVAGRTLQIPQHPIESIVALALKRLLAAMLGFSWP